MTPTNFVQNIVLYNNFQHGSSTTTTDFL